MTRDPRRHALAPAEAQHAWDTLATLPLATDEQRDHARAVLAGDPAALPDDSPRCELFLTGPELAAVRVMTAWLKTGDRSGARRDLPIYPDVVESILSQIGPMPWPEVFDAGYLHQPLPGATLLVHPRTEAPALARLIDAALRDRRRLCPGWSAADRRQLVRLLRDVRQWLRALDAVFGPPRAAAARVSR
jgi:hypothetical protein